MSIYSLDKYIIYYILYKISYKKISKKMYKPIDFYFECVIIVLTTKEREVYNMNTALIELELINTMTRPCSDPIKFINASEMYDMIQKMKKEETKNETRNEQ